MLMFHCAFFMHYSACAVKPNNNLGFGSKHTRDKE